MSAKTSTRARSSAPGHPGARKAFLVFAALLSMGLIVGAGWAVTSIRHYDAELDPIRVRVGAHCDEHPNAPDCLADVEPEPACFREACTWLILGSDSREEFTPEEQILYGTTEEVTGRRADTIIVVHRDPAIPRTVVLHIPRDLRVELPTGFGKINTAFEIGPNTMVQEVEELTGLSVNHYVAINFSGFVDVVDALDGVPMCVDRPMVDRISGLNLPEPGCYTLRGRQALAFVRARHVEGDSIPDFSRISRQQQFMRAVMNKLLAPSSVLRLDELIAAARTNLSIDENLGLYDLQDLTNELGEVGEDTVTFRVTPSAPLDLDGQAFLELVQPRADELFRRIRTGAPLLSFGKQEPGTTLSPADVTVQVWDAASNGRADEVRQYLLQSGFGVVGEVQPAPPEMTATALLYSTGFGHQQAVVTSYLRSVEPLYLDAHTPGADITVVIAPDFEGLID